MSKETKAYVLPVFLTLIYAIITYLIFRSWEELELVSGSFVCGMPFVVGVLAVLLAPSPYRTNKTYGIFVPWLPLAALCVTAVAVGWELIVCVIMASPMLLTVASGGGLAVVGFYRNRASDKRYGLYILVLLPFLIAPIENLFPVQHETLNAQSSIHIDAEADAVWEQLIAVSEIQPNERPFSYLDLFGFPRPMEAQLSGEGVGGMRRARYENGLILWEPVTVWEPNKRYAFGVLVDEDAPQPFTQIGGAHFDVMEVAFWLEAADDGGVTLHLDTQYRLSTRFNFYAEFWTDFLMRDLQRTILHVIKHRAEASN